MGRLGTNHSLGLFPLLCPVCAKVRGGGNGHREKVSLTGKTGQIRQKNEAAAISTLAYVCCCVLISSMLPSRYMDMDIQTSHPLPFPLEKKGPYQSIGSVASSFQV